MSTNVYLNDGLNSSSLPSFTLHEDLSFLGNRKEESMNNNRFSTNLSTPSRRSIKPTNRVIDFSNSGLFHQGYIDIEQPSPINKDPSNGNNTSDHLCGNNDDSESILLCPIDNTITFKKTNKSRQEVLETLSRFESSISKCIDKIRENTHIQDKIDIPVNSRRSDTMPLASTSLHIPSPKPQFPKPPLCVVRQNLSACPETFPDRDVRLAIHNRKQNGNQSDSPSLWVSTSILQNDVSHVTTPQVKSSPTSQIIQDCSDHGGVSSINEPREASPVYSRSREFKEIENTPSTMTSNVDDSLLVEGVEPSSRLSNTIDIVNDLSFTPTSQNTSRIESRKADINDYHDKNISNEFMRRNDRFEDNITLKESIISDKCQIRNTHSFSHNNKFDDNITLKESISSDNYRVKNTHSFSHKLDDHPDQSASFSSLVAERPSYDSQNHYHHQTVYRHDDTMKREFINSNDDPSQVFLSSYTPFTVAKTAQFKTPTPTKKRNFLVR